MGPDGESPSADYRAWIVGELLLVALLGSATMLFATSSSLQSAYVAPEARLVLETAIAVVATIVSVLACVRFLVDGRVLDLSLGAGFACIAFGSLAFGLAPVVTGESLSPTAAWAYVGARLVGTALIAVAPWVHARVEERRRVLVQAGCALALALAGVAFLARIGVVIAAGDPDGATDGRPVVVASAALAAIWLVALVGFVLRYRRYGRDLDSWVALAATLAFFGDLHIVVTPMISSDVVLQGDFLRLVAYGILLVGVWKAIADAEFGRAVADERARVAREIHDGLAQYLFAVSAQVSMLESGASLEDVLPRLKRAAEAAQQEARFAVLALSSAGGAARFDAALRRYVDVLTADGELDVEVDVDPSITLAPDEQIEVFRIVQEGLGNARRHAGARHVEVSLVRLNGRRVVNVRDDGAGFDEKTTQAGEGLGNMRSRAEAIGGRFELRTRRGGGTAIEVVLRAL